MARKLEFFFDCSSPWTYLAFSRIEQVADRHAAEIIWKPILVGGVFNAVNPSVYESRTNPVKPKARYMVKDMADWARFYGLRIIWPPTVFPVNSVKAMRGALVALDRGLISPYARRIFEAYWGEDRDISQDSVLGPIARSVGMAEDEFLGLLGNPQYKERLRANTQELIDRGGFGSPTIFVEGDMFFGNDRLVLVEDALLRAG